MLCVVPVSCHENNLLIPFLSAVSANGSCEKHCLLIVASPSARLQAIQIQAGIGHLFLNSNVHIFDKDGPVGWPFGPNFYFSKTLEYLVESKNQLAWLWCELDCTPIKNNWLDVIASEYESGDGAFLGVKDFFIKNLGNFKVQNNYMVGVGVYPPNFESILGDPKELMIASMAFDAHYGHKIFDKTTESKTIQHCYRTVNYFDSGGIIKGSHTRNHAFKKLDNPVSNETVLVHGCKDGSLSKITCPQIELDFELDHFPVFLAIPRCGSTYTRWSLRLILQYAATIKGVACSVVTFGDSTKSPALEIYTLNKTSTSVQSISDLYKTDLRGALFACITSKAFGSGQTSLIDRLRPISPKPLFSFSFVRDPIERIKSVSNHNGKPEINSNWITNYLYSMFYETHYDLIPDDAKLRAITGLIESKNLHLFDFENINESLCDITQTNLPRFFGDASHSEKEYNRRPKSGDVFSAFENEIQDLNTIDSKLYALRRPIE